MAYNKANTRMCVLGINCANPKCTLMHVKNQLIDSESKAIMCSLGINCADKTCQLIHVQAQPFMLQPKPVLIASGISQLTNQTSSLELTKVKIPNIARIRTLRKRIHLLIRSFARNRGEMIIVSCMIGNDNRYVKDLRAITKTLDSDYQKIIELEKEINRLFKF